MLRIIALCLLIPLIMGCAAQTQVQKAGIALSQSETKAVEIQPSQAPVEISVLSGVEPGVSEISYGLIAGKTDFRGLLKAPYVRLLVMRRDDPAQKFFFFVGSKSNQSVVPWGEEKSVEPGYFTLQLTPGPYKIAQIAIPVGSTVAEEDMELDFEVVAGKVFYVGTLDVEGTAEKIKFGGIPFIRPGFEYQLGIKDELVEAQEILRAMVPPEFLGIERNLLTVITVNDGSIPPMEELKPGVKGEYKGFRKP